jgi:two-component system sensor histidine kinase KdpD
MIFLGYAAGVGKTYAMLQAARQRLTEGVDVVAGYVETHGRAETDALLDGIEVLPRRRVEYRGTQLEEMDVDAVVARKPRLVLVDELAHTDAPGSRHPKRYQDVEELLAAGLDVYTTLNIQHIESLNDAVSQITGVKVRETIPDRVLDEAEDIEIVDLPPDELLRRLADGKVYIPEQAARAVERFFRKGNLTALREMVLRRAASRVDDQMRSYMQLRAIPGPWPAGERLLVCVGPGPLSARLLRAARRLADELKADWHALYVETPPSARQPSAGRDAVSENLRLAESLGAKVAMRTGQSIADTVVAYARQHNVTKIIVGKPLLPRLAELLRGSVVDQVIRQSGMIDVYVISSAAGETAPASRRRGALRLRPYLLSLALVAATTLAGWPVQHLIEPTNLVMLYLAAVVLVALYLGRGPSILASALSVAAFDFFFVPPRFTMAVADTQYLLTFLGFFAVALVISALAARVGHQVRAAQTREAETYEVYSLSRDLASATDAASVLQAVSARIAQTFGYGATILLPRTAQAEAGRVLEPVVATPGLQTDDDERAVAAWAFEHGQAAGEGTETLPGAALRYLPLKTARGTLGVVGVHRSGQGEPEMPDRRRLLEAFVSQAALAIERVELADRARQVEMLSATEKLQTALLNSVSHELRTPLASITGVLSSLRERRRGETGQAVLDTATQADLLDTAWDEAQRLNRLVGNLLDMSRLQAGALRIRAEPCDPQDVVGASLAQLGDALRDRPVTVDVPPGFPLISGDFVLLVRVLVNLLDNAVKYSPPGSPVEVAASLDGSWAVLSVADRGAGIPPQDLGRVFDMFQRLREDDGAVGTGLGLSISRGIVEAHGGRIRAENRPGGGTIIALELPMPPTPDGAP